MLPNTHRLSRSEFSILLKVGERIHSKHLTLVRTRIPGDTRPVHTQATSYKCGVVVGKKVAATSVQRHSLRRVVYEALELHSKHLQGFYTACILKPSVATIDRPTLATEVALLLDRACDVRERA